MSYHVQDLEYLRVGWQKVVDNGQYGSTIYVFQNADRLHAFTNRAQGAGMKLVETITAAKPLTPAVVGDNPHGLNRSEPANFGVNYEGNGGKL